MPHRLATRWTWLPYRSIGRISLRVHTARKSNQPQGQQQWQILRQAPLPSGFSPAITTGDRSLTNGSAAKSAASGLVSDSTCSGPTCKISGVRGLDRKVLGWPWCCGLWATAGKFSTGQSGPPRRSKPSSSSSASEPTTAKISPLQTWLMSASWLNRSVSI